MRFRISNRHQFADLAGRFHHQGHLDLLKPGRRILGLEPPIRKHHQSQGAEYQQQIMLALEVQTAHSQTITQAEDIHVLFASLVPMP